MNWLYYLLEANLYLLVFYAFYRLFLHDETFYTSNRYFLLFTSLIAFVLPLMQVGLLKPAPIIETVNYQMIDAGYMNAIDNQPITAESFDFTLLLYPLYLLIAFGFAFKLAISVVKILKIWVKAEKQRSGNITLVKLHNNAAFSFFNLLFIHPHLADKKAVVAHEMVHINQKHSFDILLFEILQVLCWFNPIIYFIRNDIKLLHEYIADELSTNEDMQKHEYAMFLIENSFGVSQTALTNQIFNQSILKRRINMLNKKRTASRARLRLLLAIPLTLGMLCASTMAFTKDYGYIDLLPEKSTSNLALFQSTPQVPEKKQDVPKATSPKKAPSKTIKSGTAKKMPSAKAETIVKKEKAVNVADAPVRGKVSRTSVHGRDSIARVRKIRSNFNREVRDSLRTVSIRSINRKENNNQRIYLRTDSLKRINRKVRKTEPISIGLTGATGTTTKVRGVQAPTPLEVIEVRGYKSVPRKITGTPPTTAPEVIEVRTVNGEKTRVNGVMVPSQATGTSDVKEVRVTGYKTKPKEVIEVKIIPSVKGNPSPIKEKN